MLSFSAHMSSVDSNRTGEDERNRKLSIQRQAHKYHRFVDDHLILKSGLLDKKKVNCNPTFDFQ